MKRHRPLANPYEITSEPVLVNAGMSVRVYVILILTLWYFISLAV